MTTRTNGGGTMTNKRAGRGKKPKCPWEAPVTARILAGNKTATILDATRASICFLAYEGIQGLQDANAIVYALNAAFPANKKRRKP